MQGNNGRLQYGELNYISQKDPYLGSLLRKIVDGINQTAESASVSAVGKTTPPHKIDSIQVQGTQANNVLTCSSEVLHLVLTHNQEVTKGVRYFTEVDTNPGFTQPHVFDHGTSRSLFTTLPTFSSAENKTNNQPTTYYLRSYAQYPGSDPTEPTVFGNLNGSTQIQMTGSSVTQLLSSTGSGTASPQGQQGGKGLGSVQKRPQPTPKRSVGMLR
jgi:hypothetical protein